MLQTISLNGQWTIQYGDEAGQSITVPGAVETIQENRSFSGPFVYEKQFTIDAIEPSTSYVLQFDGVSYLCEVFCNGKAVGTHEGIWDRFDIDVTSAVQAGENTLTVRVTKPDFDKESPYFFRSVLFGFIPDIMLPFGGIWKGVKLQIRGHVYFEHITVKFDTDHRQVQVDSRLHGTEPTLGLQLRVTDDEGQIFTKLLPYAEHVHISLEQIHLWSPQSPRRYHVEVQLLHQGELLDRHEVTAGFRSITMENGEIKLNGEGFYMRGVIHWGCYPDRFTPYPTYEEVKDELTKIKALGFNTVKHCLYFPPAYYYELCDELGIVTWQELPLWLPVKGEHMVKRIYEQYPKMLEIFMHYPSVSLVSLGCELDETISSQTLNDLYQMVKLRDRHMIICDNSGSGECFEGVSNASSDIYDYHFYAELHNLDGLMNEFTRSYREVQPWLFGEYNDADTFRLLKKLKLDREGSWWFNSDENINLLRQVHKGFGSDNPIYYQAEILDKYGIADEVEDIEALSYQQMYSTRKYILELTRSYQEVKGYNITAIADVPITTSGLLDLHMQPKVSVEDMQAVNGDIVVSLNKDLSRIWQNGADCFFNKDLFNYFGRDMLKGRLSLSNRSPFDLAGSYTVELKGGDESFFTHTNSYTMPKDKVSQLAELAIPLPDVEEAMCCKLDIRLTHAEGTYRNAWDIWVYPNKITTSLIHLYDPMDGFVGIENRFNVNRLRHRQDILQLKPGTILLTTMFDEEVEALVEQGVQVIAIQKGEGYFPVKHNPFYREGVKVIKDHPVTDRLAHLGYAGIQFFGVGTDRFFDKLALESAVGPYAALVRRYDARRFDAGDYLVEFAKGQGRVLLTTLNLDGGVGSQPHHFGINHFAVWLLHSMVSYLSE